MKPVRDLLKHSSIYMFGQVLSRMASVLLLPFYTHVLSPQDYGVTAILDLTSSILATIIASGLVAAVTRHHFDTSDAGETDRVWWTGLTMVASVCCLVCLPLWLMRDSLAHVTLGADIINGARFYTLTILTLCFGVFGMVLDSYLRVLKWSGVFVAISVVRLLVNIGLNVWLIVVAGMGVEGLLLGNLLATVLQTSMVFAIFVKTRGPWSVDPIVGRHMTKFAAPLVITAVTSMMMHEADRYFLRIWANMEVVGVYSLAHKIGFAVNTMCALPFLSIWAVAMYDIERLPNASEMYARIFRWFSAGMGILLLGASLSVHPVLPWLTPESYADSIDLVAVVLLGFYVFTFSFIFEVPAMLQKKTRVLVPAAVLGLTVNIAANALLIPILGAWGAGWAGVITYAVSSFTMLAVCRQIMPIPYQWWHLAFSSLGLCVTYVVVRFGCFPLLNAGLQLSLSVAVCAGWSGILFGREGLDAAVQYLASRRLQKQESPSASSATETSTGVRSEEAAVAT